MELLSSPWGFISALLVFLIGAAVSLAAGRGFAVGRGRSIALYGWHTLLCLSYYWYVQEYGGDALDYYQAALRGNVDLYVGTAAVSFLTSLLVQFLGLSLLGAFLVFNIFGSIGLLAVDGCLRIATRDKTRNTRRLATLIIFLPSVSFWSSAIGKDAISFMSAGLALWAVLDLNRRTPLIVVAVVLMVLVRPHMAGMMLAGLTGALLVERRFSLPKKLLLGAMAVAVAIPMVPFALDYAGLGEASNAEALVSYVETRQAYNMEGGGGVDLQSMSLPMKLFTYMFRPLIFEAQSIFGLAAAIDNLVLLYLFAMGWRALIGAGDQIQRGGRTFLWIYSLVAWLALSVTSANLGIAMRQKWMFAPMLILLFISAMGTARVQPVASRNLPAGGIAPRAISFSRSPLRKP
ncbi:MAG: hypothetical protein PSX71_02995 [bacterium]|nr:hypothetical protein [bacterium]